MPVRAVLFDLDNTLILEDEATHAALRGTCASATAVDSAKLYEAARRIAPDLWTDGPVADWAELFGIWWGEGMWADFAGDREEIRALHEFAPWFRREVWRRALASVDADEALADRLAEAFRRIRTASELLDPDASAVVRDLRRDHALAIVTNGASDVQRAKLARTPFADAFGAIVISVEVDIAKPDPRIFAVALERLGVVASEAVMVGDSRPRDIAGGRAAGLRTVLIDRPEWSEGAGPDPDATIARLRDLRDALGRVTLCT
jgi:putative hydrolase of the HAD superfamily